VPHLQVSQDRTDIPTDGVCRHPAFHPDIGAHAESTYDHGSYDWCDYHCELSFAAAYSCMTGGIISADDGSS
jgi:hypothetical protein